MHTPLYRRPDIDQWAYEKLNVNDGSALWHSLGCPKHKLVVGMAFYGRSFTLGSPENNGLRAPVKQWDTNGGLPGKYTNESSFLSYFEICMGLAEGNWTERYDSVGECPYAFKGNQWVGYENAHSLRVKADWLRNNSYGGAMVWALDLDDYRGSCGEKNVLFNALANGLIGYEVFVPSKAQQTTTQTPNPWWPQSLTSSSTTTTTADTAVDLDVELAQSSTARPPASSSRAPPTTRRPPTATPTSRPKPPTAVAKTTTSKPSDDADEDGDDISGQPQSGGGGGGECSPASTGQSLASFRPHPSEPSKYLWCVNGKEHTLSCPPDTVWRDSEKQCAGKSASAAALISRKPSQDSDGADRLAEEEPLGRGDDEEPANSFEGAGVDPALVGIGPNGPYFDSLLIKPHADNSDQLDSVAADEDAAAAAAFGRADFRPPLAPLVEQRRRPPLRQPLRPRVRLAPMQRVVPFAPAGRRPAPLRTVRLVPARQQQPVPAPTRWLQ